MSPLATAARVPLPRSPPGRAHKARVPTPLSLRRPEQGASFLEEISRKSAGPLASGSPPNPAGALFAAPFKAPREGWGGGVEPPLLPFLLTGRR